MKLNRVRELLDYSKYHLWEDTEGHWKLFMRDVPNYPYDGLGPIMSSETNTYCDLLSFAKTHRAKTNYNTITVLILNIILLIMCVANLFIRSKELMWFIWGGLLYLIIDSIVKLKDDLR